MRMQNLIQSILDLDTLLECLSCCMAVATAASSSFTHFPIDFLGFYIWM